MISHNKYNITWDIDRAQGDMWPPLGCWKCADCFTCPYPDCFGDFDPINGRKRKDYHGETGRMGELRTE